MRRVLKAVAITLLVPILLGGIAWLYVDVLGWEVPEWVVTILGYLFGWPLLLLGPFIPASDSPAPNAPLIPNVLFLRITFLTVSVQLSRKGRQRKVIRVR